MLFSQSAVLRLTCSDNHQALADKLDWGRGQSVKTSGAGTSNDFVQRNPILLSVLQGHQKCTELLHEFGYRIPQKVIEGGKEGERDEGGKEGEKEEKRRKDFCNTASNSWDSSWNLIKMAKSYFQNLFTTSKDDQVQSVLDFKGSTNFYNLCGGPKSL